MKRFYFAWKHKNIQIKKRRTSKSYANAVKHIKHINIKICVLEIISFETLMFWSETFWKINAIKKITRSKSYVAVVKHIHQTNINMRSRNIKCLSRFILVGNICKTISLRREGYLKVTLPP